MVEWKWGEGERGCRCKGREVSIGRFVLPAFLPAFAASTVQIPTIDFVLSFVQAAGPSPAYSRITVHVRVRVQVVRAS